jgi:hypothetical protein
MVGLDAHAEPAMPAVGDSRIVRRRCVVSLNPSSAPDRAVVCGGVVSEFESQSTAETIDDVQWKLDPQRSRQPEFTGRREAHVVTHTYVVPQRRSGFVVDTRSYLRGSNRSHLKKERHG